MKLVLTMFALALSGCEFEPQRGLTPDVFEAELKVEASTAKPNRRCELVGPGDEAVMLLVKGNAVYREDDENGVWEIVSPVSWSSSSVRSRFDMGLGGESEHSWKTEVGLMTADIEWWDEIEPNGVDSRITILTSEGKKFVGPCKPIKAERTGSDV